MLLSPIADLNKSIRYQIHKTAKFGPLMRGRHSTNVIQCVFYQDHQKPCNRDGENPVEHLVGFEPETSNLIATP